jgi:hypothetical protein
MLNVSPATSAAAAPHGRLDQVLDREQLVTVRAIAEDRDAAAFADPVEQDLEHAQPLRADERLRTQDHDLEPAPARAAGDALGLDLRLAVVADADERRVLAQRVVLRDPVHRGRGDEDGAADAGLERRGERDGCAFDVDRADRVARGLDRQCSGRVDEHVGAFDQARAGVARTSPRSSSTERSSSASLERRCVQCPHVVPRPRASREMQAEEPGPALRSPTASPGRLRGTALGGATGPSVIVSPSAATLAALLLRWRPRASNPQIPGSRWPRAWLSHHDRIDSIAGLSDRARGLKAFQRRAGLAADG